MSTLPNPSVRKRCFAPVVDARTRLLVLGSLPGEQSLAAQQYYANPQNKFWSLLTALTGEDMVAVSYAARLNLLRKHRIGLWDVLGTCEREGSLDSAIWKPAANDFERIRYLCPQLEVVGFNGQVSGKYAPLFESQGYSTVVLPSSSPAT